MAVRKVEYIISLRDKFSSKLAGINKNLQATGKRIQSLGVTLSLAVTLPIAALGATAVKLASDFEETESKFFTVFSSIRQQADETAKNLRNNFGLSSRAALQLLGDTGDLLVGFGFTEEAALKMSKRSMSWPLILRVSPTYREAHKRQARHLPKHYWVKERALKVWVSPYLSPM